MIWRIRTRVDPRLKEVVVKTWRWWTSELIAMLPETLQVWLVRTQRRLEIEKNGELLIAHYLGEDGRREILKTSTREESIAAARKKLKVFFESQGRPCEIIVRLPRNTVLCRTITFPKKVASDLREALSLQLDKYVPLKSDCVEWDYQILPDNTGLDRIVVKLAVIEKRSIDDGIACACKLGVEPTLVIVADESGTDGASSLFRKRLKGATALGAWSAANRTLSAAAVILFVFVLGLTDWKYDRATAYLEDQIEITRPKALQARDVRRQYERLRVQLDSILSRKRRTSAMVVLDEVTRVLPDDAWVQRFFLREQTLSLDGFASNAADLISDLEGSPLFSNARFGASVTQDSVSALERFSILLDITEDRTR